MRALLASTWIAGAALCLAPAAFADSTSSTSGGGANVSIVTGDNGGTTIVIDSSKPCRVAQGDAAKGSEWKVSADEVAEVVINLLRHPARSLPSRVELRPTRPPKK
jgi:hypothetical protein